MSELSSSKSPKVRLIKKGQTSKNEAPMPIF